MRRRTVLRRAVGLAGLSALSGPVDGADVRSAGSSVGESPSAFGPIASRFIAGAADCRVGADGTVLHVAVGDGFATLALPSLSVLAEERSIEASREGGPLSGVADVSVDGDRLLVPGPANPRPDRLAGFALFDVTEPSRPAQVAFFETTFPIHNAELDGGRAYLTAGDSLVVVDVTDDEPRAIGRWSLADVDPRWADVARPLWTLHDVRVRDDLAVLSQWDAGTWLVDVDTPDDVGVNGRVGGRSVETLGAIPADAVPREAFGRPGNHHSSALSDDGSVLAVGAEAFELEPVGDRARSPTGTAARTRERTDEGTTGGPGGIELYDVADPGAPIRLSTIDPPRVPDATHTGTWTTAHDFAFAGDRLLSAWYQGGVRIHDVSDPSAPRELAWWRRPGEVAFWTARPAADGAFVATSTALPADGLSEGAYVFPNRPGTQADPPTPTDAPTHADASTAPESSGDRPTDTATPTPPPTRTRSGGQPGFRPRAVLGGLAGLAAWRRWSHRRRSS